MNMYKNKQKGIFSSNVSVVIAFTLVTIFFVYLSTRSQQNTDISNELTDEVVPTNEKPQIKFKKVEKVLAEKTVPKHYINIKYRNDPVDINNGNFDYLNTSKSSWIHGAWYDKSNKYLIIRLQSTNYQYCGVPINVWNSLKNAYSFGTYYNQSIKGNFDCRINYLPTY